MWRNAKAYERNPDILKEFDFMEIFNACEPQEVNDRAVKIAEKYDLPGTGGSDAHKADCVGLAYTEVPDDITCESDLIAHVIKETVLSHSFWVYNKIGGWSKAFKRNSKLKKGFIERVEVEKEEKHEQKSN